MDTSGTIARASRLARASSYSSRNTRRSGILWQAGQAQSLPVAQGDALFTNTNTWKGLITNIIFYIPCIYVELVEWFKYQYQITTRTDVIMLCIAISLFLIAGFKDKIYDFIFRPKGKLLLNNPVYLNNSTTF